MKHSLEELVDVVYHYYPRGVWWDDPGRMQTEENRRLVAARRRAGADDEGWRNMLRRLADNFPECTQTNRSLHLLTGAMDACYSAYLYLPTSTIAPGEHDHAIGFLVSFLVPYYIVYSSRDVDDLEEIERRKALNAKPPRIACVFVHDTMHVLPAGVVKPEFIKPISIEATRQNLSFDLSPDEQPYAEWIARDIEATRGYERMPPDVGRVIVPGVATDSRGLGEATLYDCLFSDSW